MIEPRVYRATFVPALLVAVVAMFSLESRPRPLPQGLAADVLFDGELAAQGAGQLARRYPDRVAGSVGDRAAARLVAERFAARGFRVERDEFEHAGRDLVNVVGLRSGRSRRQLVIVAARDATGVPDATGSASDTAALLELTRVLAGRPSRKTLVLASVDGGALGEVGAERLARRLGDPSLVDGVLVMSGLGAPPGRGPLMVPWSDDDRRAGIGLQRTAADSIRQELKQPVGGSGLLGQLSRLALPIGIGAQGVLLEHGYDAVRISSSGELPPSGGDPVERIDRDRLGGLGRATLRTLTALDQGPPPGKGPRSYMVAVSQVMPGWVITLLAIALLLPALVASVDALARARRRREPVGVWLRWLAAQAGPLLAGLVLIELLALAGATPDPPPAPPPPSELPLDVPALVVLGVVVAATGGLWWAARFLAERGSSALGDRSAPGAGVAVSLVAAVTVLALWLFNPFAALVMVPAVHCWMLATLVDPGPPRRARVALVLGGLVPPLLVAVYYLLALSIDPLSGAWYLLMLVAGGAVGLGTAAAGCLLLALTGAALALARAERGEPPAEPAPRPVYGPGAHAGPGSLGGTESALRR